MSRCEYKPARIKPENIRFLYTSVKYLEAAAELWKEQCEELGVAEIEIGSITEVRIVDCKKYKAAVRAGKVCPDFDNRCQCERCERKRYWWKFFGTICLFSFLFNFRKRR